MTLYSYHPSITQEKMCACSVPRLMTLEIFSYHCLRMSLTLQFQINYLQPQYQLCAMIRFPLFLYHCHHFVLVNCHKFRLFSHPVNHLIQCFLLLSPNHVKEVFLSKCFGLTID